MAKKKSVPPIIVNGLDEDYIVEKCRSLVLMREVPFSLGELKVLDTYLSRINSRDPEARTVRFAKEEYEDLMEIERMRPERLGKYVDSIMQKIVHIPDPSARGGWRKYTLFSTSECGQDDDGQWWVDLTCTTEAKKLFFNIEKIGYIRYQLKNVLPLKSKHSVLLYLYLLDNRFRREWEISIEELRRSVFRCDTSFYAENYKNFKQDVMDKALKEVNEKTDLTYEYKPVRKGRKVVSVNFTLVKDEVILPSLPDLKIEEEDPNQLKLDLDEASEQRSIDREYFREALPNPNVLAGAELDECIEIGRSCDWYKALPVGMSDLSKEQLLFEYFKLQAVYTKTYCKKNFYTYFKGALWKNYAKVPFYEEPKEGSFDTDDFLDAALKHSYKIMGQ